MNHGLWCEPGKRPDTFLYHSQNGFYYHFHSESISTIYFKCSMASCTGRAKFSVGYQLEETVSHIHPPDHLYPQVLALRRSIVRQASFLRYMSFIDIVHQERSKTVDRQVRALVTYGNSRSAMQRARNGIWPPIPNSLQSLSDILQNPAWAHVSETLDQFDNLYRGSVIAQDGSHNILFVSERCLEVMRHVQLILADSTFCIAPSIPECYQVFTIVTINGHTVIPLMWVLMERKTEWAYIAVLSYLQVLLGYWMFEKVVSDFEDGLINAFESVFEITVQGCYFHSVNAMCSWARVNMTVTLLRDHEELLHVIALCCAMPLLPVQYLQQGYRVIWTAAYNLGPFLFNLSIPFLEYFRTEWLEHVNRGRTFSVSGSEHRTNNASESNNRRMKRQMGHPHPNVFQFLYKLVEFEDSAMDDLNSLQQGRPPNRERNVAALSNDARIMFLTNNLLEDPIPTEEKIFYFLHAASLDQEASLL